MPHEKVLAAIVCLAAVAASIALVLLGTNAYESVLGIVHPVGPMVAVVGLGYAGWLFLSARSWIPSQTEGLTGYRQAVAIGLALPISMVIVDWMGGFGREINVPAPDAFLFYPSIAVAAEFAFHVAPLAVAALLGLFLRHGQRVLEVLGLAAAVAIEPTLQVLWSTEGSPGWASASVGVQLVVFNVLGVYLLRRFGILQVIAYRLSYYLVWHVVWGYLRLELLFAS